MDVVRRGDVNPFKLRCTSIDRGASASQRYDLARSHIEYEGF